MRAFLFSLLLFFGTAQAQPLNVFVSVLPLKTFVEQVGGDHVDVHVMVQPGHSPATYSPSPKQIELLSRAHVFFRVGVPFEQSWLTKLSSINPALVIIDTRQGITLQNLEEHGHGDSELDPHIWTSPVNVQHMLDTIVDALTELRPQYQSYFAQNARAYKSRLVELDGQMHELLDNLSSRKFYVFHPAWGYFAHEYHLHQVAIEHEGKAPGAKSLARIMRQAKQQGIKVILVQPQFNINLAQRIADEIGGRVVMADPLSDDYINNLKRVSQLIKEASSHE